MRDLRGFFSFYFFFFFFSVRLDRSNRDSLSFLHIWSLAGWVDDFSLLLSLAMDGVLRRPFFRWSRRANHFFLVCLCSYSVLTIIYIYL